MYVYVLQTQTLKKKDLDTINSKNVEQEMTSHKQKITVILHFLMFIKIDHALAPKKVKQLKKFMLIEENISLSIISFEI